MSESKVQLRRFQESDIKHIASFCNNKNIWNNVRDIMPFPYTEQDAANYIDMCSKEEPQLTFAIEYQGDLAGSIGLLKQTDVYRLNAEVGFWIGEPFWGKGIASNALKLIVRYAFEELKILRLFSGVYDFNIASQRVMEKAGFKLEAILEKAVFKNGKILDEYRYSLINPNY